MKSVKLALQGTGLGPVEMQEEMFLREYGWTHRQYEETPFRTVCYLSTIMEQRRIVEQDMAEEQQRKATARY